MEDKIEFIDDFLMRCEDWMHGEDGNDVTICRKYINEIREQVKNCNLGVVRRSVFIVVQPDAYYYGDRHIEAVFDNQKDAEDYIFKKGNADWEIDKHDINPHYA